MYGLGAIRVVITTSSILCFKIDFAKLQRGRVYIPAAIPRLLLAAMSYDNASVDALLSDLQASVEACALIRSFTSDPDLITGLAQSDVSSLEFVEKPPSVSDVVETTRSLFEECQEGQCASADITLALQGTADSERVLHQVHRSVYLAHVLHGWTKCVAEPIVKQVHTVCPVPLFPSLIF